MEILQFMCGMFTRCANKVSANVKYIQERCEIDETGSQNGRDLMHRTMKYSRIFNLKLSRFEKNKRIPRKKNEEERIKSS